MKKFSLIVLITVVLAACTADMMPSKGNATIIGSKNIDVNTVELTIEKDDGEVVKMLRLYDAHAAVGARVIVGDVQANRDEDLETICRYEFK